MTICYKMGNVQDTQNTLPSGSPPEVPRRVKPTTPPQAGNPYPNLETTGDHDYEILLPNYTPSRPAPGPPPSVQPMGALATPSQPIAGTLGGHQGLEGVPFVLSARLQGVASEAAPGYHAQVPSVRARTQQQLDRDYDYDFRAERQS